nr:hypothetical protein B0A51_03182 [Rachicladosporium sp. CCFEE 5018]
MGTVQYPRAPTWKWDNTKGIWYWWDAKNCVRRGLDGTEVEEIDTPGRFPLVVQSPSPPFSGPGTSISDIEGHFEVQQHGVVYTGEVALAISEAEAEMQPVPIQVEPEYGRYTLLPTARIHYGKVHNIEHSAKVLPFGSIAEAHKESFLKQFAGVWSAQLGLSLGITEPLVETATDTLSNVQASTTQLVRKDDAQQLRVPLSDIEPALKSEVREPDAADVKSIESLANIPEADQIPDLGSQQHPPVSSTIPYKEYLPLTRSHVHTPAMSNSANSDTKPAALNTSVPEPLQTVQHQRTERGPRESELLVNNDDVQLQAEYDRLYGRLKRFVGLHDSALEQQSVAVQKRHHFERELDAAWESLAQCLQVMDNAVRRRADGLDAANEELDEAFRKARDRVGSAKTVQKQSAAKRQELSTAESKIRDNTKEIRELLEWRVATKELLERMDEIKADIARNSENASARDLDETHARQRPEVVAFDKAQQRVGMTRMQLQELEEEYEEQRRRYDIDLDRGSTSNSRFPELKREYDMQKQSLSATLDKDELDLQARRLECEAVGIAFQDDSLLSNIDVLDSKSHNSQSVSFREDDEGLNASSSRQQETLAHVDHHVSQHGRGRGYGQSSGQRDVTRHTGPPWARRARSRGRGVEPNGDRNSRPRFFHTPGEQLPPPLRPDGARTLDFHQPPASDNAPLTWHGSPSPPALATTYESTSLGAPVVRNGEWEASSAAVSPRRQSFQARVGIDRGPMTERPQPQQTVINIPGYRAQGNGTTFFAPGRVFEMIQTEIAGWSDQMSNSSRSMSVDSFGQQLMSKKRAMISIHAEANFCRAVPITSYGGQGVSKDGVIKSDHCIVYTTDEPPERTHAEAPNMLEDEEPMQPYAIRIDPDPAARWGLHDLSRLNLADECRVEYYYRVKNLGKVNGASMPSLETQIKTVREQRYIRTRPTPSVEFGVEEALVVLSQSGLSMEVIQAQIQNLRV